MSAAVCGVKRPFFDDLPPYPPLLSKRLRCSSSTSPIRFPPPSLVDHLRHLFPNIDDLVLKRALQECGNDLDAAIKSLNELCLGTANANFGTAEESEVNVSVDEGKLEDDGNASAPGDQPVLNNLLKDGAEWIVRELMTATSVDDARARTARMLAEATDLLQKVLERALQECGNDLDATIKSLNELCLGTANANFGTAEESEVNVSVDEGKLEDDGNASGPGDQPVLNNLLAERAEWIVRELMTATSVDDARARTARMLAEATNLLQKEILMQKEQIEVLNREKNTFKKAFRIQHEQLADKNHELKHLKQLRSQDQEQIRTLGVNNYALAMHLKQAHQQSNSFSGRFPPDVC